MFWYVSTDFFVLYMYYFIYLFIVMYRPIFWLKLLSCRIIFIASIILWCIPGDRWTLISFVLDNNDQRMDKNVHNPTKMCRIFIFVWIVFIYLFINFFVVWGEGKNLFSLFIKMCIDGQHLIHLF